MVFFILPSSSPIWQVSSLLAIISNVCFGASVVALNAYLPSLARNSEEVAEAAAALADASRSTELSDEAEDSENAGLLASGTPPALVDAKAEYSKALTTATSRISSRGIATGYLAGIILLIIALIPVTKLKGSTLSLRLAIGMSGVWWGFFSLPAVVWLPSGSVSAETPEKRAVWRQILFSWKRLGGMLRWTEIKKLRNTFKYLAAWFLLSDGSLFRRIPQKFINSRLLSQASSPSPQPQFSSLRLFCSCQLLPSSSLGSWFQPLVSSARSPGHISNVVWVLEI